MLEPRSTGPRRLLPWLGLIAFASGVPFALVTDTAPLLYRIAGVDLSTVTLFGALAMGWPVKAVLAPLVDRHGARRTWILAVGVALVAVLAAAAALPSREVGLAAVLLFGCVAQLGGVFDVAIDGYAVDATPLQRAGPAAGVRTALYRVGLAVAGGTLVGTAPSLGWSGTWICAAVLLALLVLACGALPPVARTPPASANLERALRGLYLRPHAGAFFAFVLLYKVGDRAMASLLKPFQFDVGIPQEQIGFWLTPATIVAALAGALAGGLLTQRLGIVRALLLLGLAQALSNLGYAWAAAAWDPAVTWTAALVEPFCGGLGSAPFVALFMVGSSGRHSATQYAFLTALMGLVGGALSIPSGGIVERTGLGYAGFFALTGLIALPPLLLLPWVGRWLDAARAPQATPPAAPLA
jgi:PAT family beta-lactamase induction signal transducer AmpG